jgi:hypothetical protein
MAIQYVLYQNNLSDDPNDYMARIRARGTIDLEGVIEHMIRYEGSTASMGDALSTLEDFFSAIENLLLLGFNVVTPSANYHLGMKGTFDGEDDVFDPDRHQVVCNISTGVRLRRTLRKGVQVNKILVDLPGPRPLVYTDTNSGTRNSVLTPGGIGKLTGDRLKFDPDDPEVGIFFASAGDETRVEFVSESLPTKVHFLVPELPPGDYTLLARTRSYEEGSEIRSGDLKATLTVGSR